MTTDAIDSGTVDAGSGLGWRPPRWVLRSSMVAQSCLWIAGWAVAAGCLITASKAWWSLIGPGALLALLTWPIAVLFHELGHVAGARIAGMTVCSMQVSRVFLLAQRRGWRMRLQRPPPGTSGFVRAFPDPSRPLKDQILLMIAGGPVASLSVALCTGAAGVWFVPSAAGFALIGLAAMNLATALIALMPAERSSPSDGLMLLCWLRGIDETSPEFYMPYLNGLAIAGTPADELPADTVAALATQPQPAPLFGIWLRLKAYQNRGEWARASALDSEIQSAVSELPPKMADALKDFVSMLRCEVRFSLAMMAWSAEHSPAELLSPFAAWCSPSLTARCDSLMAAMAGDRTGTVKHLDEAELWASRSLDRALAISEARIRSAVLLRLDGSQT
jgi:hypothetical protein